MNEVIELLMRHRSIRKFTKQILTEEQLRNIIIAGQHASTSSNMQAYSVIRVTDQELRKRFVELSGQQQHVADAAEFLIWCADLSRIHHVTKDKLSASNDHIELTENFIVSTVDAALAAQNSAIAAESMGLGILYVGGIRNEIAEASKLLQLPSYVYPLFGMCIGYPAEEPLRRPRLPIHAVLHENNYMTEKQEKAIAQYDEEMQQYVSQRSSGKQSFTWSDAMLKRLKDKQRENIMPFLKSRGFLKR